MQKHTDLLEEIKTEIAQELNIELNQLPSQLTITQTAKVLNVKPDTLSVWRSTGRHNLPFIKTGKSIRYRVADVANFMAENRYSSNKKANFNHLKKLQSLLVGILLLFREDIAADIYQFLKFLLFNS